MPEVSLLQQVLIPKPCPVPWDQMQGDSKVRFCELCSKNVYNLSEMSEREANAILNQMNGHLCAQVQRRPNGRIISRDRSVWPSFRAVAAVLAAALSLLGFGCDNQTTGGKIALAPETDQNRSAHNRTGGVVVLPETTHSDH